ncbi:flagellar export chaperone FliS [Alteribacter natronophilus]|uniref:flagellar export chaperone FliS n=1 Tax=Alteribacter natronophilus TaxID=2583810 RepID=UPI00110ED552|nr:flagellar export chaperone FliS [Alteribacter natronophilus]TMW72383.1 flagellar export chaperone FliS [Alteribacter natronophilus]
MALKNPYANYQQQNMQTKSPGELTLMLYDGCLKFIRRAGEAMEANQVEKRNENLIKAQAIISELMVTLKGESEVARNMMQMYDFIMSRLVDANMKNDPAALKEAERFVREFRDTWVEALKRDRQNRFGGANRV